MALLAKQPSTVVSFPPPAPWAVHRVKDGDNWWTVRDQYGFKDVWDIIAYNFNTYDSREVNWYLGNKVGCVLKTADGKSYRFSSAANPGLIYIPNAGWQGNAKLGKRPGGGDAPAPAGADHGTAEGDPDAPLSTDDLDSKAAAIRALERAKPRGIRFIIPYSNYVVEPDKFQSVLFYIEQEYIRTRFRPGVGDRAQYLVNGNELHFGFAGNLTTSRSGLVVHEAVHAMMDIEKLPIVDKHSEAAAYIAQQYYELMGDKKLRDLPPGVTPEQVAAAEAGRITIPTKKAPNYTDDIFRHSWSIAMSLIYRREHPVSGQTQQDRLSIPAGAFNQLLFAVANDPDYKRHAEFVSGYNGVAKKKPRAA